MREDISSERDGAIGWLRVTCDAPGCTSAFEGRPALGTWFDGWTEDLRRTPASTRGVKDYCPEHGALAEA
jgi:hypothetical protein